MTNSTRKFEVTQFYQVGLSPRYFVKSGQFTKVELKHIQILRRLLKRRFPQRKTTENPAKWRLTVETNHDTMTGRLHITLPEGRIIEWDYRGTVEEVCAELGHSLEANP